MTEKVEETIPAEMDSSSVSFDNLVILKELGNIVHNVSNEDFLDTVPKAKLRRVKWVPMFNYMKQQLLDEMIQSMTLLWQEENMPEKIDILEKQKEKFSHINKDQTLWRPQLANVKAQLRACDVAKMKKQKVLLESLANEYETRVNKLKKIVSAKRSYLKALQIDIQRYQKKSDEFMDTVAEKLENHNHNILTSNADHSMEEKKENIWNPKELNLSE